MQTIKAMSPPNVGDWVRDTKTGVIFAVGRRTKREDGVIFLWNGSTPHQLEECERSSYADAQIWDVTNILDSATEEMAVDTHRILQAAFQEPELQFIKHRWWDGLTDEQRSKVKRFAAIAAEKEKTQ